MSAPSTDPALRAFAEVVGEANVETDPGALRLAETATFATAHRVVAIVSPATRTEVQECVRAANHHGVPLYPISAGRNWGYGSRVPTADRSVILSLGRLAGIVDFDEGLAYVTVQPGVTFHRLREYLRERGSQLYLNAPGSTVHASIVGNTLERGVVQGTQPDKARDVCGLEVVLPDGRCVRTGAGAIPGNAAARVHHWGVGPSLDGLFLQSNLGIVTEMTLWLQPAPAHHRHFHFLVSPGSDPGPAWSALQRLRLEETITTSISMHNAPKVMSLQGRYPYAETGGQTPLPQAILDRFVDEMGARWFGEAAIHGTTTAVVATHQARVEAAFAALDASLEFGELDAPGPCFGATPQTGLAGVYWRKRTVPPGPLDPDRDRCGVLWHAPAVPFEPEAIAACTALAETIMPDHGFEPLLTLTAISARCVYAVVAIVYDRDVPGEDERALACHLDLATRLAAAGCHPYRLGLPGMADKRHDAAYLELLRALKASLDPNRILAPGRYDFT